MNEDKKQDLLVRVSPSRPRRMEHCRACRRKHEFHWDGRSVPQCGVDVKPIEEPTGVSQFLHDQLHPPQVEEVRPDPVWPREQQVLEGGRLKAAREIRGSSKPEYPDIPDMDWYRRSDPGSEEAARVDYHLPKWCSDYPSAKCTRKITSNWNGPRVELACDRIAHDDDVHVTRGKSVMVWRKKPLELKVLMRKDRDPRPVTVTGLEFNRDVGVEKPFTSKIKEILRSVEEPKGSATRHVTVHSPRGPRVKLLTQSRAGHRSVSEYPRLFGQEPTHTFDDPEGACWWRIGSRIDREGRRSQALYVRWSGGGGFCVKVPRVGFFGSMSSLETELVRRANEDQDLAWALYDMGVDFVQAEGTTMAFWSDSMGRRDGYRYAREW